jgi:hypothetical protein
MFNFVDSKQETVKCCPVVWLSSSAQQDTSQPVLEGPL